MSIDEKDKLPGEGYIRFTYNEKYLVSEISKINSL
jgi:hypothetical protein